MNLNLASLIVFYYLSIISCLGYGLLISKIFNSKISINNYGYQGLFGILFLIIYSYISNFFYAHDLLHNSILVLIGLSSFVYFAYKKILVKEKVKILIFIFSILFLSFLIFKPHDDFSYYHFQYSYYLTQFPLLIGVGQFNHGFATPSSIFYLNSLFYLPHVDYALFHISALLVFGFSSLIIIEKLFKFINKNEPNFISFFLLFSLAFIVIIFYRIAEHGTDRSAQILIFILVYELIVLINFKKNFHECLSKIFILLALIISFKAFYILYFIFFIPILIAGYQRYKFELFFLTLRNKSLYILITTFLIIIITNFFNTGCLIFPVNLTCFESMPWAFSSNHINHMNDWYEQWSKAGAGPNFRVENPENYILGFNWVSNWFDEYFFNKVSDFILGIILIVLIPSAFIFSKKKKIIFSKRKILSIYVCLLILFFEWFYNHPSLRYGGFVLFGTLLFIPASLILEKFSKKNLNKKIKSLVILFFIIFIFRNVDRIVNEVEKYNFNPIKDVHYRINNNNFNIDKEFTALIDYYNSCYNLNNCEKKPGTKMGKIFGKIYFLNEKK